MTTLVWFILATIWGTTWLFIKVGLNEDLPPFTFAGIRFLLALLPLVALIAIQRRPIPRERSTWIFMLLTGILTFTINYGLVFWGAAYISSGLTAILATTIPLFGLLLAHFFVSSERITTFKIWGVVLGLAGVTLIFMRQLEGGDLYAPIGSLAIILSALGAALSNTLVKLHARDLDPLVLTTVQMFFGCIPLLTFGLLTEGNPLTFSWTTEALVALLYLAFMGSSVTFSLLYWLIKHIEVTKTQLIPFWSTLFAVFLGWAVLGEQLSWNTFVGGAAILAGLGLATLRRRKPAAEPVVSGQIR